MHWYWEIASQLLRMGLKYVWQWFGQSEWYTHKQRTVMWILWQSLPRRNSDYPKDWKDAKTHPAKQQKDTYKQFLGEFKKSKFQVSVNSSVVRVGVSYVSSSLHTLSEFGGQDVILGQFLCTVEKVKVVSCDCQIDIWWLFHHRLSKLFEMYDPCFIT